MEQTKPSIQVVPHALATFIGRYVGLLRKWVMGGRGSLRAHSFSLSPSNNYSVLPPAQLCILQFIGSKPRVKGSRVVEQSQLGLLLGQLSVWSPALVSSRESECTQSCDSWS